MTTTPRIDTEFTNSRIASTAAPSPPSLSPRPTQRPAAIAPASVTRTSSRARLRSGASPRGDRVEDVPGLATTVGGGPDPGAVMVCAHHSWFAPIIHGSQLSQKQKIRLELGYSGSDL